MGKFNWWRRSKKRKPLAKNQLFKGKSIVLQKIEHGDYDYSDYYNQAQQELIYCKQDQNKTAQKWKGFTDSLSYALRDVEKKYRKRYNKLMEDHLVEEQRLLLRLKEDLAQEFKVDVWDEALELAVNKNLLEFYELYKILAQEKYDNKI